MEESYDKRAEENLLAMKREIEEQNRLLLRTEYLGLIPAMFVALGMIFLILFVPKPEMLKLRIAFLIFAFLMIIAFSFIAIRIEQKAGYYECQKCHHRYVPTYWQTNLAPHIGRTRYMKCPACNKRGWQKKVLSNSDSITSIDQN